MTLFQDGHFGKAILEPSQKVHQRIIAVWNTQHACVCCVFQECDQVHIDDVSSDDNGQDLRYDFNLWFIGRLNVPRAGLMGYLSFFLPVHTTLPPTVSTQPQPVPISA